MKNLIVALATTAALIAPSATLALDGVFTFPTFYDEFSEVVAEPSNKIGYQHFK